MKVTAVTFHPQRFAVYVDDELYDQTELYDSERILLNVMEEHNVTETETKSFDYDFWEGAPERLSDIEKEYGNR